MSGLQKNVASQKWTVFAFDRTDNTPKTGDAANITAKIMKDGGAASATNDVNPTEVEDGFYDFDLTQAETNADKLNILPESSTADIQVIGVSGVIFTVPSTFADNPMRGTNSAALASVVGALADTAAGGEVTSADTLIQYVKQLINVLVGAPGVVTFPAESAPGNAVSLAEVIRAIHADVTGLAGSAMRGTNSAALASVLGAAVGASISADLAAIKAETVLIVADTNELQTDWLNGGRLDLILDAILVDTAVIGAAGAGLTSVGIIDISAAGLAKFLTVDTGETVGVAGSVGKIAQGTASGLTAAAIWANTTRTLTSTAATIAAVVAGTDLSVHRGDTLTATITGLGDISDRDKLWFTIKEKSGDPADSSSLVQITLSVGTGDTDGLQIINKAAAVTAANGSIVVDDATAGDITVTLKAVETAKLEPSTNRVYDIQVLRTTGEVVTLTNADCSIVEDVSRDVA